MINIITSSTISDKISKVTAKNWKHIGGKFSHTKRLVLIIAVLCIFACLFTGCGNRGLTAEQRTAIVELAGDAEIVDITGEVMNDALREKFPAVRNIFTVGDSYVFLCTPHGYYKEIELVAVIDSLTDTVKGMRIVKHYESETYVRNFTDNWFTNRFMGKGTNGYLLLTKLESEKDNEIVQITGATITTQAVINGVNAAIGLYREYVLKQLSEAVPYKIDGYTPYVNN